MSLKFHMESKTTVKSGKGISGVNLFRFFDDGIRKRLPAMVAKDFYDRIISNIDNNSFGFTLSNDWVKDKERRGKDTRPFIEYGTYRSAITIKTVKGHLTVGFIRLVHPRAGVTVGQLANRLEYGDAARGLPARPLWRRTVEQFQKGLKKDMKKKLKSALNGVG